MNPILLSAFRQNQRMGLVFKAKKKIQQISLDYFIANTIPDAFSYHLSEMAR